MPIRYRNILKKKKFNKFNKNIDNKFSVQDSFLEYPSSGTIKAKILEKPNNFKIFGSKKIKGQKVMLLSDGNKMRNFGRKTV